MPAHLDHPPPGVPFDPVEFRILGWLWLEERHAQLAAVEAWHGDTLLGSVPALALVERPDVCTFHRLAPGTRTGFEFNAHFPGPAPRSFSLSLRARLLDGTLIAPVFTAEITPPDPARDPLLALRQHLAPTALGLEIGAHAHPVAGLTPFFTDAVEAFAGSTGCVDFLSDALALPLPDASLDYLCSSHVLEHLPNPLAALHEWHRVLRPGGWLYLVVPDRRHTFDAPRATTPTRHFLRDFLRGAPPADSAAHIDEFVYQTDWARLHPQTPADQRAADQQIARADYLAKLRRGEPIDIHFHTFTPDSLHALLRTTGFIGSPRARFELAVSAERYPPDRLDGIAVLLRKRPGAAPAPPDTIALPHALLSLPPLPLVCPLTLAPLHAAAGNPPTFVATPSGRTYAHRGPLPNLLPPAGETPNRPWRSRSWRLRRHLAAALRLALRPASSA